MKWFLLVAAFSTAATLSLMTIDSTTWEDNSEGWSRAALVELVNRLWQEPKVVPVLQDVSERRGRPDCVSANDEVWSFPAGPDTVSGPLTSMTLIGSGDAVHTIDIWFPIVAGGAEKVDRAFSVLSGLFRYALPEWQEASEWPLESLKQTWTIVGDAMNSRQRLSWEQATVRATIDGVRLSAVGVPPDFVRYQLTVREGCTVPE
jgi:hypothetical protein